MARFHRIERVSVSVTFFASLGDWIAALTHERVRGDAIKRMRHQTFIGGHLAAAAAGLAFLPLDMALFGAQPFQHVAVYAGFLAPVCAVTIVSRTGRLFAGYALCCAAILLMALAVAAQGGPGYAAACAWLVVGVLEAIFSMSPALIVGSAAAALIGLIAIGALQSSGVLLSQPHTPGLIDAALVTPAMLAALALTLMATRLHALRRHLARVGEANYESLSGALGDLVLRHDRSGAVHYANHESEPLFGLPSRDLMGRGLFERIHVADRPAFLKTIADAADNERAVGVNLRLRKSLVTSGLGAFQEPVFVWVELRARRVALDGDTRNAGDSATVISVIRDVTSVKEHEIALEAARLEAERANQWKDRFLANFSHELRTPLNAIIGFSEMLGNDELMPRDPAKRSEYANIINASGLHLLSVVNSILDMSKIEAGRFEIVPEPFELAPLIDQCCDMVRLKAEAGGVRLLKQVPAYLDELVADKRACKQILINLLSNAVKFTPHDGKVTIAVRVEGNSLLLSVADTGIGISPRELPHIGDPFYQARDSYDRPYEGTGLGLSVVRGLVGLHGGAITIESAAGEGTCVTVRLPADCRRLLQKPGAVKIEAIPRRSKAVAEDHQREIAVKKIA
jgi:cell cycle sensor histidine kinase DivJ